MAPHLVAIAGAAGRMGAAIAREAANDPRVAVAAAIEAPGHPALGKDVGDAAEIDAISVPIVTADDVALGREICVIDFSLAAAAAENADRAAAA
ncbi:MAG: 4-hydroxy-tetrahydrodipicolinate reductase, partial [Pseudomonadota bacterium]